MLVTSFEKRNILGITAFTAKSKTINKPNTIQKKIVIHFKTSTSHFFFRVENCYGLETRHTY